MTVRRASQRPWVLLFVAVALVAANMRMTITGVGPLLEQIAADQGVPTATLGALGSVPLIAWAIFSPFAHWISTRIGLTNAVSWSLVVLALGTVWRSLPGGPANLWLGTALIGVGLAVSNVLMPAAIKRDFPDRLALVMGAYSALLGGMGAVIAGVVVPISHISTDDGELGWRFALLVTGALLPLALVVWIWAHRATRAKVLAAIGGGGSAADAAGSSGAERSTIDAASPPPARTTGGPQPAANGAAPRGAGRRIWADPVAWLVSTYMGTQSIVFYVIATWFASYETSLGRSPEAAGLDLMIYQLFGVIGSMLPPFLLRGRLDRWVPSLLPAIGLIAWAGISLAPAAMPVWIVVGGVMSGATLTMALTLMAQRARTQDHAAALSGMAQSVGYTIAAVGPITFGWIHALTGSWVVPFAVVWLGALAQIIIGVAAGRPRYVLEPRAE